MPSTDLNNKSQTKITTSQQKTEENKVNINDILFWKCYLEYCISVIVALQSFFTQKLAIVTVWTFQYALSTGVFFFPAHFSLIDS